MLDCPVCSSEPWENPAESLSASHSREAPGAWTWEERNLELGKAGFSLLFCFVSFQLLEIT